MLKTGCLTLIVILLLGAGLLYLLPHLKRVEQRAPVGTSPVSGVIALEPGAVHDAILKTFKQRATRPQGKFQGLDIAPAGEGIFPDDFQLRSFARDNPLLAAYTALDPAERKLDLYLRNFTDDYWTSEYFYNGAPAKFQCAFILHLQPAADASTRIEVIEHLPTIWVGKTFDLLGRHGPDFYYDIRFVGPTTSDRVEMLDTLRGLLTPPPESK